MCIIIIQNPGVELKQDLTKKLWELNSDGGGFAFIDPEKNRIRAFKSLNWEAFWADYRNHYCRLKGKVPFILHMRIATHGTVCVENCHPFWVNEHTVMFHNGIVPIVQAKDDTRSDSKAFAEELLPTLSETWLDNAWIRAMMEEWVGWSRLAFLTNHPDLKKQIYTLNTKEWEEYEGLLLSNGIGTTVERSTARWSTSSYAPFGSGGQGSIIDVGTPTTPGWGWDDEDDAKAWQWTEGGEFRVTIPLRAYAERKAHLAIAREALGLTKPIAYTPSDDTFECFGCDAIVSEEDGTCDCLNMWCGDCSNIAAECKCAGGWSKHLVPLAKVILPPPSSKLVLMHPTKEVSDKKQKPTTQEASYIRVKTRSGDETAQATGSN